MRELLPRKLPFVSFTVAQIETMLKLQHAQNCVFIGPDWRGASKPFYLAVLAEAAEGVNHLAWPWWKKLPQDFEKAKVEVIDILHFFLAQLLVEQSLDEARSGEPSEEFFAELASQEYEMHLDRTIMFDEWQYDAATMSLEELFAFSAALSFAQRPCLDVICEMAERLEMQSKDIVQLYTVKGTLNMFRQAKGYKTGAYKKEWQWQDSYAGRMSGEDNDFVQWWIKDQNLPPEAWDDPTRLLARLRDAMEETYAKQ